MYALLCAIRQRLSVSAPTEVREKAREHRQGLEADNGRVRREERGPSDRGDFFVRPLEQLAALPTVA